MSKPKIPIFYACDRNFIKYTIVSLTSLIENASAERSYRIYILHTDIDEEAKKRVFALERPYVEIIFVDVTSYLETIKDRLPLRHYYTKTTYFRFFIAEMFPAYNKAIYIDSDTIVNADISQLFDTEIGDSYLGACHEQVMVQTDVFGTYCERVVGVSRHNFFNAGVMLINCEEFRCHHILDRFIRLLGEYNFVVTQDEDYLNLLCKDHVYFLDQRWNTEVLKSLKHDFDVNNDSHIIHYIMTNKPWHYQDTIASDVFWNYAERTSVYPDLRTELEGYTDEERLKDRLTEEHLAHMALEEINRPDHYQRMLDNHHRNPSRVLVMQRIEEYENAGTFDIDVEDDPPSRMLMPDEIDYLRKSPLAKWRTLIAHIKAKQFLNHILKTKKMIIKEIRGLENLKNLSSGAVITMNHFHPFDSFALHKAYLESGTKRKLYRVIREGNYTSFPGFYGYLMRNFYTLPLSSNMKTMHKFTEATDKLLRDGNLVLFYPEQSMWYNYRKPKPLKPGAYRFAIKNDVPLLPIFITMKDTDTEDADGYPIQEYTIHIEKPIRHDSTLSYKDAIHSLMDQNAHIWQEIYEREYSMPKESVCVSADRILLNKKTQA